MKKILLLIIILLFCPLTVQANAEIPANGVHKDSEQIESLYEYISNMKTENELLKDIDIKSYVTQYMKTGDGKFSVKKFSTALITYAFKEVVASIKLLSVLVIIAIICALLQNLQKAFGNDNLTNIAYFACYSLVIVIIVKSFYIGVEVAKNTMNGMTDFMAALMPILLMLLASVGAFTEAAVMDPIVIGSLNISAGLFLNIIIPIIFMAFVLQFVNNISEEFKIEKLTKLLNQVALWGQGIIMTIFIGILTIRGITSKTIDQVAVKTAKYAVDNFVPIVGKSLSDAISTVAGYSLLLKNALSSLGLVVILLIVIFPIIKILVMAVAYKLIAALIEPISDSRLVNCIGAAGDSLILVLACLICISVMFFIMIAIVASAGRMAMGG